MYTTTQDTLDMIRDYLDGTLTRADAEGWAELEDFARAILEAPECEDCGTTLATHEVTITTAGRVVCATCAEATV